MGSRYRSDLRIAESQSVSQWRLPVGLERHIGQGGLTCTNGLRILSAALCYLSYTLSKGYGRWSRKDMVGRDGIAPSTNGL
jgi:hypothetical protein